MKKYLILAAALLVSSAFVATSCSSTSTQADTTSLTVSGTPGGAVSATQTSVTFSVTSNAAWTVSKPASNDWITAITPDQGEAGEAATTVTVTFSANEQTDGRFATLTVTAGEGDATTSRDVTISQLGKDEVVLPVEDLGDGSTDGNFKIAANKTLTADKIWNLRGYVYVPAGVTLTIEPGTIIKGSPRGKSTLVIMPGAKIMAMGTQQKPIVFTSGMAPGTRKPGDWGGLVILGKAKVNDPSGEKTIEGGLPNGTYGGATDTDSSGEMHYVRVEFAGIEYATDNEINGITFGGVGSGTKVDHIQVSYSGDDSYEWFGGAVDAKYLVAYGTWDDDFDTDNGFRGRVQFGLIMRDPKIADKSASNGFESDGNANADQSWTPATTPVFANISSFGPVTDPNNYVDQGKTAGSSTGVFQSAVQLRRSTQLSLFNSVLGGWPIGLIIENDSKGGNSVEMAQAGNIKVNKVVMAGMQHNFQDKAANAAPVYVAANGDTFVSGFFNTAAFGNATYPTLTDLKLNALPTLASPLAIPTSDSPLASGAAWTDAKVSGGGFDTSVGYIGAFGPTETSSNNWTTGWTNFDPQNTVY